MLEYAWRNSRSSGFQAPAGAAVMDEIDDAAREQVDNDSDVEPSVGGPDIGEAGDPPLVGPQW
jgi:hypothetical protein